MCKWAAHLRERERMAALALLEDIASRAIRRKCVFREQADFFAHDDEWLVSRCHLPRATLLELCDQLHVECNHAIPAHVQVLFVLGFLATGTFQREFGYNTVHSHAQAVVECTFDMLKGRWLCLDAAGGRLLYLPKKAYQIILHCCEPWPSAPSRGH